MRALMGISLYYIYNLMYNNKKIKNVYQFYTISQSNKREGELTGTLHKTIKLYLNIIYFAASIIRRYVRRPYIHTYYVHIFNKYYIHWRNYGGDLGEGELATSYFLDYLRFDNNLSIK